jgi:hypothetical protein
MIVVAVGFAIIAAVWVYAFRWDLGDRWDDWRLDREFRRRHRKAQRLVTRDP